MLPIVNGLFLNAQYAEIPPRDLPKVAQKSYRPVLKLLLKRQKEKFLFGLTGRSIEILAKDYPDIIDLINQLVKKDVLEIIGSSYSNPILTFLPEESKNRQIKTNLQLIKKYFGVKPAGFHLPEFAWDPTLSATLKKFGFQWTIILQHQADFSQRPNEFAAILKKRPAYSADAWRKVAYRSLPRKILTLPKIQFLFNRELKITDHQPFYIQGVNSEIAAFKNIKTWGGFVIAASGNQALQTRAKLQNRLDFQAQNGQGFFIPLFVDLENINFGGNSPLRFTLENFDRFLDLIAKNPHFQYQWPEQYLKKNPPQKAVYIKTSSGEPSALFEMWEHEPDSLRLERLCQEIRENLKKIKTRSRRRQAEKLLMLAENGDGRGWNPVPERKLACFCAAVAALRLTKP